jgi:hypothetical protein
MPFEIVLSPLSQTTVPRPSREGIPETSTLPSPALPGQPYYAALGLAACGYLPQPLGTEVAAITARSRQRERAAGGDQGEKGFWISYTSPDAYVVEVARRETFGRAFRIPT